MSQNPAKTLEILFAIDQQTINRDLRRAEDDLETFYNELAPLMDLPPEKLTSEQQASLDHLWLVYSCQFCRRFDTLAPELKTFYAASGADSVSRHAKLVAAQKDTLAELSSRMVAICRREGLPEGQSWKGPGQGPPDFRALNDEFRRVLTRVADTVFTSTLRRYHMDEHADLFEKNPNEFHIRREIARRVIIPVRLEDVESFMDDNLRTRYGAEAILRIRSRARELRAKYPFSDSFLRAQNP